MWALRSLIFILLYVLIFIYAMAFTNEVGWSLFVLMTLVLVIEIASLLGSLKRLRISSTDNFPVHVGEKISLPLKIQKSGKRPLLFTYLLLINEIKTQTVTFLFYHGQTDSAVITWQPQNRGTSQQLSFTFKTGDPFGWFEKSQKVQLSSHRLILPANHLSAPSFRKYLQNEQNKRFFGTPSFDIKSYRHYRPGDPLKQMDWKLSSRQQMLILREYQQYQEVETYLIFYGSKSIYFEEMLSFFYTLQKDWIQANVKVFLFGKNVISQPPTVRGFAKITPLEEPPIWPDFTGKQVILVTPEKDQTLTEHLLSLKNQRNLQVYDYNNLKDWERKERLWQNS